MKRILIPILVMGILLLSACGASTTAPPAESPPAELEPTQEPESPPTLEPTPPEESEPILPKDKDQYATILKLSDSKGNCEFHSEYNGREPTYIGSNLYRLIKVGEIIVIRVDVYNEIAPPVIYEFIGEGFPNMEQLDNEVTFEVTDKLQTAHLRVFVKNSDEKYRAPYYDDMIQIFYKVENS